MKQEGEVVASGKAAPITRSQAYDAFMAAARAANPGVSDAGAAAAFLMTPQGAALHRAYQAAPPDQPPIRKDDPTRPSDDLADFYELLVRDRMTATGKSYLVAEREVRTSPEGARVLKVHRGALGEEQASRRRKAAVG